MKNAKLLNYKILMLDLDGTLVKRHNKIDKKVGKLLQEFVAAGGIIMFNTGRSLISSLKIKDLLFKKYNIEPKVISCFNGSIIYDCIENKIIKEHVIDYQKINTIVELAKIKNIKIGIYNGIDSNKTSLIIGNTSNKFINFLNSLNKKFDFKKYNNDKKYLNVYKILCFLSLNKKRSFLLGNYLSTALSIFNEEENVVNYTQPTNFLYEITSVFSNKGKAIPTMLDIINSYGYSYNVKDICAIGDSNNDLPMFGDDAINNPTVGLALALGLKLNETHKISNEANKTLKKPHLLAKFIKKFVFNYN